MIGMETIAMACGVLGMVGAATKRNWVAVAWAFNATLWMYIAATCGGLGK